MPNHIVSLTVTTKTHAGWANVYSEFCTLAKRFGGTYDSVNVSSQIYDPNEPIELDDEYYDEYTMLKAFKAVSSSLEDEAQNIEHAGEMANSVITALQNAGILFRERRPEKEES